MSDAADKTTDQIQEQTRAVTVVKERLISESNIAIWDTAALEHMGRVGAIMASSGLGSQTIFTQPIYDDKGKATGQLEPASRDVVVARCVMIANVARDVGADPLMFMQTASIISNKLHLEGKTVNAIIRRRTGVTLRFRFGLWHTDHIEFPEVVTDKISPKFGEPVDPTYFHGAGDRLAVRAYDPEDPERYVDGSVGLWKTDRSGSPWSNVGNHRRQLRYRAAPEWARAYEPGAVLGIYSDADEDFGEEFTTVLPRGPGVMARLPGNQHAEGFDHENGTATTEDARANVVKKRAARKTAAQATPALPAPDTAENIDPATGEVLEGATDPQDGEPAQNVEPEPDTQDSATDASPDSQDQTDSSPPTSSEPTTAGEPDLAEDVITEGYPEAEEIYMINGDEWDEKGRRATYQNGEPFSAAGRLAGLFIYEDHAPEVSTAAEEAEDTPPDEFPADFQAYIDAVEAAPDFASVKTALGILQKTQVWKDMTNEQCNKLRADSWGTMADKTGFPLPDHRKDVSAFRMWMEDQEDAGKISTVLEGFFNDPEFQSKPQGLKDQIKAAAMDRIALLNGD